MTLNTTDKARYGFLLLLCTAIACIYLPGLDNALLFDDFHLKLRLIHKNYGSLWELKQRLVSYGSFVWLEALWGENWPAQRVVNMLIHMTTVLAVYAWLRRLLAHAQFPSDMAHAAHFGASREAALAVGMVVFALNPMAVYAVAYLIQRSILLATLFSVLACLAFMRGLASEQAGRKIAWYSAALVAYVLAVLSKEYAIMTAALAPLLYVYVRRPQARTIAVLAGTALLLVSSVAAFFYSLYSEVLGRPFDAQSIAFVQQLDAHYPGTAQRIYALSIFNEAGLFLAYGLRWLVPYAGWMSVDMRPAFPVSFASPWHLAGALGYVLIGASATWALLRRRDIGQLLGLLLLLPVLWYFTEFSTVWIQDPLVLYRSYLWAVPLPGLLAVVLTGLRPRTIYVLGVVLTLVLTPLAVERVLSLKNEQTAWQDAIDKIDRTAPANALGRARAHVNMGVYLMGKQRMEEAQRQFEIAIAYNDPGDMATAPRVNLGVLAHKQGQHAKALEYFAAARQLGADGISMAFYSGLSQFALGQFAQAEASFKRTLDILPQHPGNQHLEPLMRERYADAALAAQHFDVAITELRTLAQRQPEPAGVRAKLDAALKAQAQARSTAPSKP